MANAEWAPKNPIDPHSILSSAVDDRVSKNYKTALQKQLWFHHNVLEHNRSFYGVRLSFALSYWVELANEYPPALKALEKELALSEAKVKSGKDCDENPFHDFSSINRELNRFKPVVSLFKYLDKEIPESARKNFNLAKSSLIRSKDYELYVKYVNSEKDILKIQKQYLDDLKLSEKEKFGPKMKEYAENSYIDSVTTLVAVLSVTGNDKEAKEVHAKALEKMNTVDLKSKLDLALSGEVPDPWL